MTSLDLRELTDPLAIESGAQITLWRRLRDHDPVAWTSEPDAPGFWFLTYYCDEVRVLKEDLDFSVARGSLLDANPWERTRASVAGWSGAMIAWRSGYRQ